MGVEVINASPELVTPLLSCLVAIPTVVYPNGQAKPGEKYSIVLLAALTR